jgi:methyltransferase (TIGR00027 family)
MKDDRSSGTAMGVAAIRAIHQLIDDVPHILEDPVSLRLIDSARAEGILRDPERYRTQSARALRSHVVLRSRYAEDSLFEAARSGVRQFVSLGAGYDTFAYRQPEWAQTLRIVEIDHPATQSSKLDLLERKGIRVPENVEHLPLDLEKEALGPGLAKTAFDPARPAFVACLGVLAYLHVETVHEILDNLGKLPRLSRFAFTFATRTDASQALADRTAAHGEPWHARFDPDDMRSELVRRGFSKVSFLDPSDAADRYYKGRADLPAPRKVTMGLAIV